MTFLEIEQKYRIESMPQIRLKLRKIGAKKIAEGNEENEFWDRLGELKSKKQVLRLRRFGKTLAKLTLKGARQKSKFSKRLEIETDVNYDAMKAMLLRLGFDKVYQYSKKRKIYKVGKAEVVLDTLKGFGDFLEIESNEKDILRIEKLLELSESDREYRSYLQMIFEKDTKRKCCK